MANFNTNGIELGQTVFVYRRGQTWECQVEYVSGCMAKIRPPVGFNHPGRPGRLQRIREEDMAGIFATREAAELSTVVITCTVTDYSGRTATAAADTRHAAFKAAMTELKAEHGRNAGYQAEGSYTVSVTC